uniref:Immunoglobulin V-set domain-containing protein n=1 Tax=Gallus gallus TaxID=9031 RepID=A0A8V1A609_CHICK
MVCRGWGSWEMSFCHDCAMPASCRCPPPGVCAQLRLETSGGGVQAPGDSVQLSCQGSGFSFGSYHVLWYRQALGGRLEWLSYIWPGSSNTRYSTDVKGRATVSRDDSRSVSYLYL